MTPFHRYILTFLLTVTVILGTQAQTNASPAQTTGTSYMMDLTVDHPVYLGFLLVDEPTVESMSEMCEYYGLTPESTTDGYTAYRASDGTLLRFKQSDDPTVGVNGNLIEIQTKASQKTLNKILSTLNYKKNTNLSLPSHISAYDHGSALARNHIRCLLTSTSPRRFTFFSIVNTSY